jgi:predicted lipid-binding transport protein (Tim44 family)
MQSLQMNSRRHGKTFVCGLAALTILAGTVAPAPAQGPNEEGGTAAGAILGGVIGGLIGGRGAAAVGGAIAGAAIGSFIGNRIGAALDEEDRIAFERATRQAIVSGRSQRYRNKRTGVRARAQVVSSQKVQGKPCRTVKQEVVLKDGKVMSDTVRACRGPNGWEV